MPKSRFFSVLQTLASHRVDFIVVGGVAAVLRGAPVSTFDLDLVHSTAPDNIGRLLAALESWTLVTGRNPRGGCGRIPLSFPRPDTSF